MDKIKVETITFKVIPIDKESFEYVVEYVVDGILRDVGERRIVDGDIYLSEMISNHLKVLRKEKGATSFLLDDGKTLKILGVEDFVSILLEPVKRRLEKVFV
jgi:hypothetical protein